MTEPKSPTIIEVAVPLRLDTTFHYSVPPELVPGVRTGVRVLVPFGRRTLTGYTLGTVTETGEEVKDIIAILDPEPLFTADELEFFRWAAGYYLHPLGEVIKAALPSGINLTGSGEAGNEEGSGDGHLKGGRSIRNRTLLPDRRRDPHPAASGEIDADCGVSEGGGGGFDRSAPAGVRGRFTPAAAAGGQGLHHHDGTGDLP